MSEENMINFLYGATVVDTETTGKDPENCEICEVALGRIENDWDADNRLLRTHEPIPPEASSKSLISNRMVADKPAFDELDWMDLSDFLRVSDTQYYIAHNAEFDRNVLKNNLKKRGENIKQIDNPEYWVCTWRLAKAVYGIDFDNMQYGLQYLRFYLDLDVPDDIPAHRADADVKTCGRLLERLLVDAIENGQVDSNLDIGPQLYNLCWQPARVKKWPFGKWKGHNLEDIPTDYYQWAMNNMNKLKEGTSEYDLDLAHSVAEVLEKRLNKQ